MNYMQVVGKDNQHVSIIDDGVAIHKDLVPIWLKLKNHAQHDGISLSIASGFRDFDRQLSIWNLKFSGELPVKDKNNHTIDLTTLSDYEKVCAIMTFSALPGASRHHWGTDIDVYATNLLPKENTLQLEAWEYQKDGYFYPLSLWLKEHMSSYQFFFPYRQDNGGIAIEPWHLSFRPIADNYDELLTIDLIGDVLSDTQINGKATILNNLSTLFTRFIKNITKDLNG